MVIICDSLTLPNFTTAATNGANIPCDQEDVLTSNHEDSDVPQQDARARPPFILMKEMGK